MGSSLPTMLKRSCSGATDQQMEWLRCDEKGARGEGLLFAFFERPRSGAGVAGPASPGTARGRGSPVPGSGAECRRARRFEYSDCGSMGRPSMSGVRGKGTGSARCDGSAGGEAPCARTTLAPVSLSPPAPGVSKGSPVRPRRPQPGAAGICRRRHRAGVRPNGRPSPRLTETQTKLR
jgi:hypothetical protein